MDNKHRQWVDKVYYWAWPWPMPTFPDKLPPTPTVKRIEYATIIGPGTYLNGPDVGKPIIQYLAIGVWDDSSFTPLNRGDALCELEWHRKFGSQIILDPNLPEIKLSKRD